MLQRNGIPESAAKMERCKRDYESDVAISKARLEKVSNLKKALFDFLGYGYSGYISDPKLAEMVGEIVFMEAADQGSLDNLMAEWQQEIVRNNHPKGC